MAKIRKLIETGDNAGVCEVHLANGVGQRRDNPVIVGLLEI